MQNGGQTTELYQNVTNLQRNKVSISHFQKFELRCPDRYLV